MAEEKTKKVVKKKEKKGVIKPDLKSTPTEDSNAEMERFFHTLEEQYKDIPPEELGRGTKRIQEVIEGKINWTELFNFTPEMLYQIAEFGFTQFKVGRYADAERVFKVLTIIDHSNAYYHSVLGSVFQRQRRYADAITEYTQAIEIDPNDIVSYTNRGEIHMRYGLTDEAKADLNKAIELDPKGDDKFANRARMLIKQIEKEATKDKGGKKNVNRKP